MNKNLVVSGVQKIRELANNRNWCDVTKNIILHRNCQKLIFARFASKLYRDNYDKCFTNDPDYYGRYSVYLERLDGFILERIREAHPELKGVSIIFYNSESALRRETEKFENTAIEYII